MIKIYMQQEKWRLRIGGDDGETFEFNTKDEMWKALERLIELKETNGKLKERDYK